MCAEASLAHDDPGGFRFIFCELGDDLPVVNLELGVVIWSGFGAHPEKRLVLDA